MPPYDPFLRIEGLTAVNGPASINAVLLDSVTSVPYEGVWFPWMFVKQGSLEVSGSMSTLSCQLYGTNAMAPTNSYTITMTGTAATGNNLTTNLILPTGTITAVFADTTGNTTTQIATGVAAAINTAVQASTPMWGIVATSATNVVTITWPAIPPTQGGGGFVSQSSPAIAPMMAITTAVSGSASETMTLAAGSTGSAVGSAITALSMTQFTVSARFLKVRITTLTGGGANITATAQGSA